MIKNRNTDRFIIHWFSDSPEQGLLKDAIPNFERTAELMPDHARVRYNLAISYQNLNRPADAEENI